MRRNSIYTPAIDVLASPGPTGSLDTSFCQKKKSESDLACHKSVILATIFGQ